MYMEKEQLQELIENNKEDIFSEIKDEISDDTLHEFLTLHHLIAAGD